MSIEVPQAIAECWQILTEYIPERDQHAAAEHLIGFCQSIFTKKEMLEVTDLDSDLSAAYESVGDIEEEEDEYDYEADDNEDDE